MKKVYEEASGLIIRSYSEARAERSIFSDDSAQSGADLKLYRISYPHCFYVVATSCYLYYAEGFHPYPLSSLINYGTLYFTTRIKYSVPKLIEIAPSSFGFSTLTLRNCIYILYVHVLSGTVICMRPCSSANPARNASARRLAHNVLTCPATPRAELSYISKNENLMKVLGKLWVCG